MRRLAAVAVACLTLVGLAACGSSSKPQVTATTTKTTAGAATNPGSFVKCPAADGSSPRTTHWPIGPPACINPAKHYTATFDTTEGSIVVALDTTTTPRTTNNFVFLSRFHFYDGTPIFRTDTSIDIIQGGGSGPTDPGPGYNIPDEGGKFAYAPGDLVMARSQLPNSGGAEWFFVAGPKASLLDSQGTYVTFGKVTTGLDVVQNILALNVDNPKIGLGGAPSRPVTIKTVTINES